MIHYSYPVKYDRDDPLKKFRNLIDELQKKLEKITHLKEIFALMNIYHYGKEDFSLKFTYLLKERGMGSKYL